jgi:hypothetical protein
MQLVPTPTVPTAAATPPPAAVAPLAQRALLVALHIGEWHGRRRDREITARIAREHGADPGAGSYIKALVPRTCLARIAHLRGAARAAHYHRTLPWHDDGFRILPVDLHLDYMDRLRTYRAEFQAAVADFVAAYDESKAAARAALGSLYRERDYPATDRLRAAFAFDIRLRPLPAAHDWRIDLPEDTLDRLRRELAAGIEDAQRLALADLYRRLAAAVSRLADTLAQPDKIFRDSLLGNLRDLCRLLPTLNLSRDPALAALTEDIERRLVSRPPHLLRHDPTQRHAAARDAAAFLDTITDRLASYTGAAA